jgi:hypothetical protein
MTETMPLECLPVDPGELVLLGEAGRGFLATRQALTERGMTIVAEVAGDSVEPLAHYPRGDVYDADTHAQYYFHSHRDGEIGHFHVFLRAAGMPDGMRPLWPAAGGCSPPAGPQRLAHLVAIGVNAAGDPDLLFTTNRWVTAESWYAAADLARLLPRFRVGLGGPSAEANRWITAVVALFRPQIRFLLAQRDARVARQAAAGEPWAILEDDNLEVTSQLAVDAYRQIAEIDRLK